MTKLQETLEFLSNNKNLTSLNLNLCKNNISDAGKKAIADAIESNEYLTSIKFSPKGIISEEKIREIVKRNLKLKERGKKQGRLDFMQQHQGTDLLSIVPRSGSEKSLKKYIKKKKKNK